MLQGDHTLLDFAEALLYSGWKGGYVGPVISQTWLTVAEASSRVMLNNIGNKIGFIFPLFQALVYLWSKDFFFSCPKY